MSSINVSRPPSDPYAELMRWKLRGEDLLRDSGQPYTVIRPGWFDATGERDTRVVLRQGDTLSQGGVRRRHVAQALLAAIITEAARQRTVEVFSGPGEPVTDWDALYAATSADPAHR